MKWKGLRAWVAERTFIRLEIEGLMPERALLRLKRERISVYNAKKVQKNQILLWVKSKDEQKVFAIFPNVCYNISKGAPYSVRKTGIKGVGKPLVFLKNRVGLALGGILFCACTLFADGLVFGVRFVGSDVYAREARIALAQSGVKPFLPYRADMEDEVTSKLLCLEDVEFCSVKKQGLYAVVEMRLSPPRAQMQTREDLVCRREGTLISLSVLSGTPTVKVGQTVKAGDVLVGAYHQSQNGEKQAAAPVARAGVACTYEAEIAAADKESAFAEAYLALELTDKDVLGEVELTQRGETFHVKINYVAIETINM